jgi:hypothetical protein
MRTEKAERLVVEMRGKGGTRRAALFTPDFRALMRIDAFRLAPQKRDFLFIEEFGQE